MAKEAKIESGEVSEDIAKKAKKRKIKLLTGNDRKLVPYKVPFDIPALDKMLGGGIPLGRFTEIIGNSAVGKTFFTQLVMANFQRKGHQVAYVDVERRYDPVWFSNTGVDIDHLYVAQPSSGENALDTVIFLIEEKFGLVILDSVAALSPTAELEADMDTASIGAQARLFNRGLRKITEINSASDDLSYKGTAFLAINQLRAGIGGPYTPHDSLPAGKGQQYFASILLRISRGGWIKQDEKRIGFDMIFRTDKNNLAEPYQECTIPFRFSGVLDTFAGLFELALDLGIVSRKGPYFLYDGKQMLGKEGFIEKIKTEPSFKEEIERKVFGVEKEVTE